MNSKRYAIVAQAFLPAVSQVFNRRGVRKSGVLDNAEHASNLSGQPAGKPAIRQAGKRLRYEE